MHYCTVLIWCMQYYTEWFTSILYCIDILQCFTALIHFSTALHLYTAWLQYHTALMHFITALHYYTLVLYFIHILKHWTALHWNHKLFTSFVVASLTDPMYPEMFQKELLHYLIYLLGHNLLQINFKRSLVSVSVWARKINL